MVVLVVFFYLLTYSNILRNLTGHYQGIYSTFSTAIGAEKKIYLFALFLMHRVNNCIGRVEYFAIHPCSLVCGYSVQYF